MQSTYDAVIIGGGPAGLNAALVLGRARRSVLLCDDRRPRNAVVDRMHGFITRDGATATEFRQIAIAELERYPSIDRLEERVEGIASADGAFTVTLASGLSVTARRVLLTTGVVDQLPSIDGISERWGQTVFVCPFCDAWEFQDRRIAVYAPGREAVGLAQELYAWTKAIFVCVDCDDLTAADRAWIGAANVQLHVGSLRRITGAGSSITAVELADGRSIPCDALFLSVPLRQNAAFVEQLGCSLTEEQAIYVDADSQTSVRGCYAAGDAVTAVHQVVVAAASGARAAIAVTLDLTQSDVRALIEEKAERAPA